MDEELSEITYTEKSNSMVEDELESSVRKELDGGSAHYYEDSNASVCSSNSSLPSLKFVSTVFLKYFC